MPPTPDRKHNRVIKLVEVHGHIGRSTLLLVLPLTPHLTCGLVEKFLRIESGSGLAGDLRLVSTRGKLSIFPQVVFLRGSSLEADWTGDFPRVHGLNRGRREGRVIVLPEGIGRKYVSDFCAVRRDERKNSHAHPVECRNANAARVVQLLFFSFLLNCGPRFE